MPPFLLSIFRNPWAIGAIAVLLVGGIQQARVWSAQSDADSARTELAEQRQRWTEAVAEGRKAAQEALQAALRREREAGERRAESEREAAERLRRAAQESAAAAAEWRGRYEAAKRDNPSCEAWASTQIACPIP